jgi:hypothetical protein
MTSGLDAVLLDEGTGASIGRAHADAICFAQPIAPARFAIVGALTGATACVFASELLDWTSADVIVPRRPLSLRSYAADLVGIGVAEETETPVQRRLEEIKRKSGLTWGQVADAMGVETRAVHLWRRRGGISAAHEERLHELNALIDSVDLGTPTDVRTELAEAAPSGSLLERLRAGVSPGTLIASAPWRSRARHELLRNLAARTDDGVLDEDYAFLLYLDDESVHRFADRATAILEDPGATRRAWESTIDAELTRMEQPAAVAVEAEEDEHLDDEDEHGALPLFEPADLGIPLGVGAIAARRALHEGV